MWVFLGLAFAIIGTICSSIGQKKQMDESAEKAVIKLLSGNKNKK